MKFRILKKIWKKEPLRFLSSIFYLLVLVYFYNTNNPFSQKVFMTIFLFILIYLHIHIGYVKIRDKENLERWHNEN